VADLARVHLPPLADREVLDRPGVGDTGRRRACQAVAAGVVIKIAAIADRRGAGGVHVGLAPGLLLARVTVQGQLGDGLEHEAAECLPLADGCDAAIGSDGRIRQLRRAVTAVTLTGQAAQLELEIRGERQDHAGADAAGPGRVVGAARISRRAVSEASAEGVDLVVAETRVDSDLRDDVGSKIDRVVRCAVEQAATGIRRDGRWWGSTAGGGRCGDAVAARIEAGLWALERNTGRPQLAEVLDEADLCVTGPVETRDVLRVDRQRYALAARIERRAAV